MELERVSNPVVLHSLRTSIRGFPSSSVGKESACNAGDQVQSLGRADPLKEMATCSSTLAWKIPWTEKPGRLQSMGLQRVRHDCVSNFHFYCNQVKKNPHFCFAF